VNADREYSLAVYGEKGEKQSIQESWEKWLCFKKASVRANEEGACFHRERKRRVQYTPTVPHERPSPGKNEEPLRQGTTGHALKNSTTWDSDKNTVAFGHAEHDRSPVKRKTFALRKKGR